MQIVKSEFPRPGYTNQTSIVDTFDGEPIRFTCDRKTFVVTAAIPTTKPAPRARMDIGFDRDEAEALHTALGEFLEAAKQHDAIAKLATRTGWDR